MVDAKNGHMKLSDSALAKARVLFSSYRCGDDGMVDVIRATI